jgi:glycosyltransferase involved in cell wall biosynthesis
MFSRSHRPYALFASTSLAKHAVRYARCADAIHVHGYYHFHVALALALSRRYGLPISFQPHGVLEPYQLAQRRVRKAVFEALVGRAFRSRVRLAVFASASEADRGAHQLPNARRVVVPLGTSLVTPEVPAPWAGEIAGRDVVLFLGRIAPKKRVDLVIAAWPQLQRRYPNALLVIAGADDGTAAAAVAALPHETASTVRLVGFVAGGTKTWLLRQAACFVLPSENENFGIAVAEALTCGTPVVVSDAVATAEHVQTYEAGVVVSSLDPSSVANGVIQVLDGDRSLMRKRAEQAGLLYSWDRVATVLRESVGALVDECR